MRITHIERILNDLFMSRQQKSPICFFQNIIRKNVFYFSVKTKYKFPSKNGNVLTNSFNVFFILPLMTKRKKKKTKDKSSQFKHSFSLFMRLKCYPIDND